MSARTRDVARHSVFVDLYVKVLDPWGSYPFADTTRDNRTVVAMVC